MAKRVLEREAEDPGFAISFVKGLKVLPLLGVGNKS